LGQKETVGALFWADCTKFEMLDESDSVVDEAVTGGCCIFHIVATSQKEKMIRARHTVKAMAIVRRVFSDLERIFSKKSNIVF